MVARILFLNALVFLLWKLFGYTTESAQWMQDHFLVSWQGLTEGRLWTLVTSEFSHNLFLHFLVNMFVLRSFGRVLERVLGPRLFLRFYLAAAVVASLGHCLVSSLLLNQPELPALGASGAISGLVLLFSLLYPREMILVFGLIPVPAIFGALAFIGLDIWGLVTQIEGGGLPIGHGAHLGGAFSGIIFYFLYLRKKFSQKRAIQLNFR